MSGSGTGTPVSGVASAGGIVTPPAFEPITLAELKLHLRLDSGSFADNIDETSVILPGSHAIADNFTEHIGIYVLTGSIDPAASTSVVGVGTLFTTELVVGDQITVTGETRTVATITDATHLTVSAAFANNANDTSPDRLTKIEVLGYTAVVVLAAGANGTAPASGTVDVKIQDSDDNVTFTDWGTAFTQITTSNDNATYEKAYTGTKRYIKTVAKVLGAACEFGTSVIRLTATSVEDDLLNAIITTAREHIEDITSRALITQTWDFVLQKWPDIDYIKLPYGNLQSVSSIKWKDTDGTSTTLTLTTDYLVETNGEMIGRIVLPYDESWPSDTLYPSNPITIRYVCGWTTRALVPYKIKAAIKMICSKLYESRGEDVLGQTVHEDKTVNNLLMSARLWDEF